MVKDWRGLGDVVADAAAAIGIKPDKDCGCKKRQEALNRLVPFKRPEQQSVKGVSTCVGMDCLKRLKRLKRS